MLDINLIRENPGWVADQIAKRGGARPDFEQLIKLDNTRKRAMQKNEEMRAKRNTTTEEIAQMKRTGVDASPKIVAMKKLGDDIARGDKRIAKLESQIDALILSYPNTVAADVIAGGKEANAAVKTFGTQREFGFKPRDHVELCTSLGLIDYERGTRMSGSGHWVYTGMGARLEWALLNYFIDFHVANGYTFVMPPHILNYDSGVAAGQFPKYSDEVFILNLGRDKGKKDCDCKFLLPTAETALINMHRGETIPIEHLPIKYAGFSPCYRGEPGGYGAAERGTIRGHQFNKIEMFIFAEPDNSWPYLDELTGIAEQLVEGLGLHYKTVKLAAGDVGPVMAKTYDVEVWIPSLGYKECSSCSNATDFQARRAGIRTKIATVDCSGDTCKKEFKKTYVHTLNASGLATSRLIPAIVEQFQNADGTVTVPPALRKYLGGTEKILPTQ